MKILISIHIPADSEILVKEGESVSPETAVALIDSAISTLDIEMARILKIKPQNISQYLKRKIGDKIAKGDVIAEKKAFFSSMIIKSPTDGNISSIDLKAGSLTMISGSEKKEKIYAALSGKVKKIKDKVIDIESEAKEFEAEAGSGERTHGRLHHLKGENIGVLDVKGDIDQTIILVHNITGAGISKANAMGVRGFILEKEAEESQLPFTTVNKTNFIKLEESVGRETVIDPVTKKIYILD